MYFLLRRDYRFVVHCLLFTGLFSMAIPVAVSSVHDWVLYNIELYDHIVIIRHACRNMANNQYMPYAIHHLLHGTVHDRQDTSTWIRIGLAIVAVNLLIVNRLARRDRQDSAVYAFLLLFTSMPFAVETCWPHYFGWLPFGQAWLALRLASQRVTAGKLAQLLLLLTPSILLSSILVLNWAGGWQYAHRWGLLLISSTLLMVLIWLQVPSLLRQPAGPDKEPESAPQ